MNRNIAFYISSLPEQGDNSALAEAHLADLANQFKLKIHSFETSCYKVMIVYKDQVSLDENNGIIEFPIGNLGDAPLASDRFLKIVIKNEILTIENDYAGCVPVFYSNREYLAISNIEPCTALGSGATESDISLENLYGYLKYSYYLWDETLFTHMNNCLPDTLYKFNSKTLSVESDYLASVVASNANVNLSDQEVSDKLHGINDQLVQGSLAQYDKIILPLSSGYDSRLILASLAKRPELKAKLYCYTYGSIGSVEVEAARRLTKQLNVNWEHIELPLKFLEKSYLKSIHAIFGSSLHMHGMYQFEFFEEVAKRTEITENTCLTSGFMTGAPAGHHIRHVGISDEQDVTNGLMVFSQSRNWSIEEFEALGLFDVKKCEASVYRKFKKALNRFDGNIYQKSAMFDIWVRQRTFSSYYPRTLEWELPTVSPHMGLDYVNFFMSISERHLYSRLSVELMFKNHYPQLAKIISNSHGLKSMNSLYETSIFFISRVFNKYGLSKLLPQKYSNADFEFDLSCLRETGKKGIYPLLNNQDKISPQMSKILNKDSIEKLYELSIAGDLKAYGKLITLQSVGFSISNLKNDQS
ncbi:MAG: hypothetical protein COC24_000390 [Alphaproteobacteria bacterium]|nr:hypothetical protein [Alphaproteobacteria bacterium]